MFVEELFMKITTTIAKGTGVPTSIPLIGDWREIVVRWARNNPEVADKLADELYQLLGEYYHRRGS